jgi:cysteine synthase
MTDTNARLIAATAGNVAVAKAIEAATAANQVVTVMVMDFGKQ